MKKIILLISLFSTLTVASFAENNSPVPVKKEQKRVLKQKKKKKKAHTKFLNSYYGKSQRGSKRK
ncbi:hypothetical protein [Flammeovirga kamogawensis]|uniref:Uncharacterized protein n=1 Tax=Flammeovirga kamogawensis TaxID=373891 RepID=A0ABX8GWY9_9BACT|nr:hypothetical protein [Flammeovirga kamogawensis]MBB6460771.1 hypothetical protein [Flammeovirga kamogawensis]QWG08124.1 hypothetical protein KM029_04070 [Flammeovirga kamogawensis]TRX69927.1 hypothetical protein EO216_18010 [Flammeovirga kamogawensis]